MKHTITYKVFYRANNETIKVEFDSFAKAAGYADAIEYRCTLGANIEWADGGSHSGNMYSYQAGSNSRQAINRGFISVVSHAEASKI